MTNYKYNFFSHLVPDTAM